MTPPEPLCLARCPPPRPQTPEEAAESPSRAAGTRGKRAGTPPPPPAHPGPYRRSGLWKPAVFPALAALPPPNRAVSSSLPSRRDAPSRPSGLPRQAGPDQAGHRRCPPPRPAPHRSGAEVEAVAGDERPARSLTPRRGRGRAQHFSRPLRSQPPPPPTIRRSPPPRHVTPRARARTAPPLPGP